MADFGWILKIAGIGITVAVACQVLTKTGRDEQAMLLSVAGVLTVFLMLLGELAELFDTLRSVFGL